MSGEEKRLVSQQRKGGLLALLLACAWTKGKNEAEHRDEADEAKETGGSGFSSGFGAAEDGRG